MSTTSFGRRNPPPGSGAFQFSPGGIDWRNAALDTVRRYPVACLFGAAAIGFWVGRHRGKAVMVGVGGLVTNMMVREMTRVLDGGEF